ncbi:MAG: NAD(P)/FAD-dependent oxidoreductase [Candidatus Aenigmarchaeota archaeon]|nr:NAD(P)/FAD-dependent oxidoreductase [Candidatus Aenigmarchaeota archaeon]
MADVIVVGGGPGGATVAKEIAKNGFSVALYEKRQEIGAPKRCAEGVALIDLKNLGLEVPQNCIRQGINGSVAYAPNGNSIEMAFDEIGGYILERKVFDKWLCEEAARAGAKIQAKTDITEVIKENGKVCGVKGTFMGEPFEERCKVLVAADGIESRVSRMAGLDTTCSPLLTDSGVQFEMAGIKISDPNKLHLFFGTKVAPRGYVWIFPKGKDVANVGIGIIGRSDVPAIDYLKRFIEQNEGLKNGSILEVNAGGIPVGGLLKKMNLDNFLVVGDAAHQVSPIHGGGIVEAQYAGRIAGEVIIEALKKNDTSEESLESYNARWWAERGNDLKNMEKIRELLEVMSDCDLDFLADNLTPEHLLEISMGKGLGFLAKIVIKRPQLMKYIGKLI